MPTGAKFTGLPPWAWRTVILISQGCTYKEISWRLGVAEASGHNYIHHAKRLLGVGGCGRGEFVQLCERLSGCVSS